MRIVHSLAVLFFCFITLSYFAISGLRFAGRFLSQIQHPLSTHIHNSPSSQQTKLCIQGQYQSLRTELGLDNTLSNDVPFLVPSLIPVILQDHPLPSGKALLSDLRESLGELRIEASSLSVHLQDERWHDLGLRKMLKRSPAFGVASAPLKPSQDTDLQKIHSSQHSPHFLADSPTSSRRQLFFSIDAIREPRASLKDVLRDYSNFSPTRVRVNGRSRSSSASAGSGSRSDSKDSEEPFFNSVKAPRRSSRPKLKGRTRTGGQRAMRLEH